MGRGVGQDETYAQLVEKRFGVLVLNAGVSSYGTVREMMMLARVQTDNLKYLVVQYSGNDYGENEAFFLGNNALNTMKEEEYVGYMDSYQESKKYFFGKYLLMKIEKRMREFNASTEAEASNVPHDEIGFFLNALMQSPVDLKGVQIVAFAVSGRTPENNRECTEKLRERISHDVWPPFIRDMIVLDTANILDESHFYALGDHLNQLGHEIMADAIVQTTESAEKTGGRLGVSL